MQVYNIFLYVFNILMQNFRNKVEVKLLSKFEAGKKNQWKIPGLPRIENFTFILSVEVFLNLENVQSMMGHFMSGMGPTS